MGRRYGHACMHHEVTRTGFLFLGKLYEDLGLKILQDGVVQEAKKAPEPLTL